MNQNHNLYLGIRILKIFYTVFFIFFILFLLICGLGLLGNLFEDHVTPLALLLSVLGFTCSPLFLLAISYVISKLNWLLHKKRIPKDSPNFNYLLLKKFKRYYPYFFIITLICLAIIFYYHSQFRNAHFSNVIYFFMFGLCFAAILYCLIMLFFLQKLYNRQKELDAKQEIEKDNGSNN